MSELRKSKAEKKAAKEEKKAEKKAAKEGKKAKRDKKVKSSSKKEEEPENEVELDTSEWKLTDFSRHETLGTGTFGRVYLVQHKESNSYYALKVLRKSLVVRLKQVQHVNNEKEILIIAKPCLFTVRMFKHFKDQKNLYLLSEYVQGGELFSHLRAAGRFSTKTARFYAAEIVLALEFLHDHKIVYRDLKPENLLLDHKGHIKVTDFGFAKVVSDNRTFTLCGTPEYLAPEVIKGKGHGTEVDWWALGILVFEMLAGYPPFYDENPFGIYEKILLGRIAFPSHIDSSARDLIKKLLASDRTRRLGNLKDGAVDVKKHRFFKGIDWEALNKRKLTPPIQPNVQHPGDTSNFEEYEEEAGYEICLDESIVDIYADVFADF